MMNLNNKIAYFTLTASLLISHQAWAINGLGCTQYWSNTGRYRRHARVANAHDSTWMILNPASISSLGREFDYSAEVAKL